MTEERGTSVVVVDLWVVQARGSAVASAARAILAGQLGVAPTTLRLVRAPCAGCGQPHGKPRLHDDRLQFNVSHSDGLALVAVSQGHEVGVDLERSRARCDRGLIVGRCFTAEEHMALRAAPDGDRQRALGLWTRKEAVVKCMGQGLDAMEGLVVSTPPAPPRVLSSVDSRAVGLTLADLRPARGYLAALAVDGRACLQLRWHRSQPLTGPRSRPHGGVKRAEEP